MRFRWNIQTWSDSVYSVAEKCSILLVHLKFPPGFTGYVTNHIP